MNIKDETNLKDKLLKSHSEYHLDNEQERIWFEQVQDIKCQYQKTEQMNKTIRDLLHLLDDIDTNDASEITSNIIDFERLAEKTLEEAENGPASVKAFLENFDLSMDVDFYYLDQSGHIDMIDSDRIKLIFDDVENMTVFNDLISYEAAKLHSKKISGKEYDSLVDMCQKNGWLRKHGYAFEDGDMDDDEYGYSFRRCEKRIDLMSYFSYGNWAIRDGFIYDDMAFVQQVNGGDEYWGLIKHGEKWFDFESITFQPTIKRGEFYKFLNEIHDCGIDAIEKVVKKENMKKKGLEVER